MKIKRSYWIGEWRLCLEWSFITLECTWVSFQVCIGKKKSGIWKGRVFAHRWFYQLAWSHHSLGMYIKIIILSCLKLFNLTLNIYFLMFVNSQRSLVDQYMWMRFFSKLIYERILVNLSMIDLDRHMWDHYLAYFFSLKCLLYLWNNNYLWITIRIWG